MLGKRAINKDKQMNDKIKEVEERKKNGFREKEEERKEESK